MWWLMWAAISDPLPADKEPPAPKNGSKTIPPDDPFEVAAQPLDPASKADKISPLKDDR